ncbi:MAG: type IV secretion system DNA-binding domain-containing protein [Planctomycetia bacterium]|nr:type IV secretion system DNA-binding domain-containing protein [Planctomycetia bacterium]
MNKYSGPNDPRFASGSGFLQIVGLGAGAGLLCGYAAIWEAISLYKTSHFLSLASILKIIHTAGVMPPAYAAPLAAGGVVGLAAGAALGWKIGDIPAEIHVRGRKLTHDPKVAARVLRPPRRFFRKSPPPGVNLHPAIKISQQQECRHMLLLGGSGSGKTSILWPVINQSVARGDRALIFSFKGDFQQKAEFGFSLLAPWDARSVRWQLGCDIRTRLHAESLAKTLIPTPEKDPIWAQGAQGLLTAIISEVQAKYGENWGFFRLAQACSVALSDYDSLVSTVMNESPLARSFLMGKDSKTTASYLAQMASNLSDVVNLGVADFSNKGKPWSVRDWLAGRTPNAAILGYLPESEGLSQAFCSSIIEQTVKQILGFPDCAPDARRIWLFLDEVPQAGKIPSITSALEAARSKGCRVALGMQGVAQLEEHGYSKNTLRIWAGQCGIKIIANLSDPDDQKWASNLLGDRDLERYQSNISTQNSGNSGQSGGYQRATESVMLPASFGTDLFVDERKGGGPTALIVTAKVAAIIKWPFPPLQVMRLAFVAAPWTMPGFVRPVWGKVPLKVAMPGGGGDVPPVKPDATKQQLQPQEQDIIYMQNAGQPQDAGGGVGEMIGDQLIDHALDAVIPGAGMLHTMLSAMSAGDGADGAGVAPVVLRKPQQHQDREQEEDLTETEIEEEAE